MAHFARIQDGIVQEVIVVNDEVLLDQAGIESEAIGVAFLKETFGADTEWAQASYNAAQNGFRTQYPRMGDTWTGEEFVSPVIEETP
jgi:hypothetical protein